MLRPRIWIPLNVKSRRRIRRIRIDFVGLHLDPDPRGQKLPTKTEKKFHVWTAGRSLFRAEVFSCGLNFLHKGLVICKLQYFNQKIIFFSCKFLLFLVIKKPESGSGSPRWNQFVSETLHVNTPKCNERLTWCRWLMLHRRTALHQKCLHHTEHPWIVNNSWNNLKNKIGSNRHSLKRLYKSDNFVHRNLWRPYFEKSWSNLAAVVNKYTNERWKLWWKKK
jgi:hypothetical protein